MSASLKNKKFTQNTCQMIKIRYNSTQTSKTYNQIWGRGGIGRRTGFRFQRRKV